MRRGHQADSESVEIQLVEKHVNVHSVPTACRAGRVDTTCEGLPSWQMGREKHSAEPSSACEVKSSRGVRPDHKPDQQVADERHKPHCDDEMPKVPAEDCLKTGSSSESVSKVCSGMHSTSLTQWRVEKTRVNR